MYYYCYIVCEWLCGLDNDNDVVVTVASNVDKTHLMTLEAS